MTLIEERSLTSRICGCRFMAFLVVSILIVAIVALLVYYDYQNRTDSSPDDGLGTPIPISNGNETSNWGQTDEIDIFREYLRLRTDHPNINYEPCVEFLKDLAKKANLPVSVYYPANDENPIVVMTWLGSQPELPSIMLNSHMDVVPAFDEYWTHPPFAAEMDEQGNIFARGAQDAKCIGMQYLAAIRALKKEGMKQFKRTIHVIFVPDEEMGSKFGMKDFVYTKPFESMNVGFVLDEGAPSTENHVLPLFYAERVSRGIEFIFHGKSGHGSIMHENTAAEKFAFIVQKFNEFRKIEALKSNESLQSGSNGTSINLTIVKGGLETNVVPPEMRAIYDIRIGPDVDINAFDEMVSRWCQEAGSDITINYISKQPNAGASVINDTNPFWMAFKNATDEMQLTIIPTIFSAASDSRFIRKLGIPSLGFSPMVNTIPTFHGNDEYLNADVYLAGIEIYKKIILRLGNVE